MLVNTETVALALAGEEETRRIAHILDDAYGFSVVPGTVERFLEKTASSNVFRCTLTTGNRVVVKESFWHQTFNGFDTHETLQKAYETSEKLRSQGVNLPAVYQTKERKLVFRSSPGKVTVLEFLEGSHFSSVDWEFSASGKALADFHRGGITILNSDANEYASISKYIPVEKTYEESRMMYHDGFREQLCAPHACTFPEVCGFVREHIAYIDEAVEFIDASGVNSASRRQGILHNDFGTNNTLVNSSLQRAYFLDVDQLGVGPLVWDLGNTLASYASNYRSKGNADGFPQRAELFLKAYHDAFPLPFEEYLLILAATQRWDVMRVLRTMRRHHFENDRLPDLIPKVSQRFMLRIKEIPTMLSFLTREWLESILR